MLHPPAFNLFRATAECDSFQKAGIIADDEFHVQPSEILIKNSSESNVQPETKSLLKG
jgi:hypothetical protein